MRESGGGAGESGGGSRPQRDPTRRVVSSRLSIARAAQ